MILSIFVFVAFFVIVIALIWSGVQLFSDREDPLGDRLEELQAAVAADGRVPQKRRRAGGGFNNSVLYFISLIPGGEDYIRDTEREMNHAGIRQRGAVVAFAIGQALFMAILMGGMLYLQKDNQPAQKIGGLAAMFILGYTLPNIFLKRLMARYRQKLQDALPDTVDMLGIVLGTGLSLDQAFLRVSEEMQFIYPELASEFYTVVMQVKAGQERTKAFQQLVRRTGIDDIKSLAAMIVQSERFGTSLSHSLKVYADALRTRRRLRTEAMVAKAGIKMLFPIVLFILPALFVITLVPGVLSVLRDLKGGIGAGR